MRKLTEQKKEMEGIESYHKPRTPEHSDEEADQPKEDEPEYIIADADTESWTLLPYESDNDDEYNTEKCMELALEREV